jgi:hypothetical protein
MGLLLIGLFFCICLFLIFTFLCFSIFLNFLNSLDLGRINLLPFLSFVATKRFNIEVDNWFSDRNDAVAALQTTQSKCHQVDVKWFQLLLKKLYCLQKFHFFVNDGYSCEKFTIFISINVNVIPLRNIVVVSI